MNRQELIKVFPSEKTASEAKFFAGSKIFLRQSETQSKIWFGALLFLNVEKEISGLLGDSGLHLEVVCN